MIRIYDGIGVLRQQEFETIRDACAWIESNPPELKGNSFVYVLAEGSVEYCRLASERSTDVDPTEAFDKLCECGDDMREYPFERVGQ